MASPKRPRLSLKISTSVGPSSGTSSGHSRNRLPVDPRDPTALNTLSNVYVTTIERSMQAQRDREPLTAINTLQAFSLATPVEGADPKHRAMTPHHGPQYYPETPLTAQSMSPRPGLGGAVDVRYPSTMTATPPLSGTTDSRESRVFTFSSADIASTTPTAPVPSAAVASSFPSVSSPRVGRQQAGEMRQPQRLHVGTHFSAGQSLKPPYTPSQARHSILRNSPLPPRTAIIPPSPRRQSQRLLEKAARRVGYNSPIEQEIITNKYTRSHIDLLSEDASPMSPGPMSAVSEDDPLDAALAFTPNEVQDGGQTPGPFEVVRRRVAGSGPASPSSPTGIRKRKRKEKKRRWVWTIGQNGDEDDEEVGGAVAALRAEAAREAKAKVAADDEARTPMAPVPQITFDEIPTPSVESVGSGSGSWSDYRDPDVDMTDCSSVYSEDRGEDRGSLHPNDADVDMKTPTEPRRATEVLPAENKRDTPIPELNSRRDTPVPNSNRDTPVPALCMDVA